MDLKSGCALEAGFEDTSPRKTGVMRPGASRHWEDKSFFDQNKNKRNFQGRFKNNYNNPPPTKTI
jgi:hypothetical protein